MKKAIVLNPHDDDAIIGIGGILIQLLKKNWQIIYVQMTDGRYGSDKISPLKLKKIRLKESEKERKFLGINQFYNFDIEDGTMGELEKKEKDIIIKKLVKLIEDYQPNIIFLPARVDNHIDHRMTYLLTKEALEKSKIKPLEIHYLIWFFPFLKQDSDLFARILKVPIDKYLKKKIKAIKLHYSQEKRRNFSKLVEAINTYFSLVYHLPEEKENKKAEIIAVSAINKNYNLLIRDLENAKDVTTIFHGKRSKKIKI